MPPMVSVKASTQPSDTVVTHSAPAKAEVVMNMERMQQNLEVTIADFAQHPSHSLVNQIVFVAH